MSGRIDHTTAAKDWIENSVVAQASREPNNEQLAAAYAGVAQVHATLALVEQQRIANLLTLALVEQQRIANLLTLAGWVLEDVGYDLDKLGVGIAGEIWEGLGL